MKRAGRFGLLLLLGGSIAASIGLYMYKIHTEPLYNGPLSFIDEEGILWAKRCMDQYPETYWLVHSKEEAAQEQRSVADQSFSEQLLGERSSTLDRTLMTLNCLKLILKGTEAAYLQFTEAQPDAVKLSKESFQNLHIEGLTLANSCYKGLSTSEMVQALEIALILGDIGKVEAGRRRFKSYGAKASDNDDFYGEVMQILKEYPQLSFSFAQLQSPAQELLIEAANLAHYGQIAHLEGGPAMFTKLKSSHIAHTSPMVVLFGLFVHQCDVAGALGHENNRSSLAYTEWTHQAIEAMKEACLTLADLEMTEWDAYDAYLQKRAEWLGLDPTHNMERVLARIGAMLKLFTPEEGALLKNSIEKLDEHSIISQLDFQKEKWSTLTPYYISDLLANLSDNRQLGATREERLQEAIVLALPFIADVLEMHQELVDQKQIDPDVPLNFNTVAQAVKTSPQLLSKELFNFCIDKKGNVFFKL
ncbi:MAG: hypothetical protein WAM28_00310 [Chlamydiales bacterium]